MILTSAVALTLLLALNVSALDESSLKGSAASSADSKITDSIKSIFSSFSSSGNAHFKHEAATACCGAGCPIGLCNGRTTTVAPSGTTTTSDPATKALNFAQTTTPCCARSCPDGHCRFSDAVPTYSPQGIPGSFPPRPPNPRVPGWPDSGCPGGCGRECGISCPCVCDRVVMTSIYRDVDPEATPAATSTDAAASAKIKSPKAKAAQLAEGQYFDLTDYFHTRELDGLNQDVLPLVVETSSKNPVTLLADIDLALTGNYISSEFLKSLELTSSTPISKGEQEPVALGIDAFLVTPHSTIKLNILAGSRNALKKFQDVEFNVFDLPTQELKGKWEPEVFLGVTFLRQARALTLSQDFAGQGAVGGIPVLVRDVVISDKGWDGVSKESGKDGTKDEL